MSGEMRGVLPLMGVVAGASVVAAGAHCPLCGVLGGVGLAVGVVACRVARVQGRDEMRGAIFQHPASSHRARHRRGVAS